MLSVMNKPLMLSVVILNVVILSVIALNVIMLNVRMLIVIKLSVIMLNVAAPTPRLIFDWNKKYFFHNFFRFSLFFQNRHRSYKTFTAVINFRR
jgi:hypothetical protein